MKLKDVLGKIVENKKNNQLVTTIKKKELKKSGFSCDDLLNMKIDSKLKKLILDS